MHEYQHMQDGVHSGSAAKAETRIGLWLIMGWGQPPTRRMSVRHPPPIPCAHIIYGMAWHACLDAQPHLLLHGHGLALMD